jgi:hypothetical protein
MTKPTADTNAVAMNSDTALKHLKVDYCVGIAEMGRLLEKLCHEHPCSTYFMRVFNFEQLSVILAAIMPLHNFARVEM